MFLTVGVAYQISVTVYKNTNVLEKGQCLNRKHSGPQTFEQFLHSSNPENKVLVRIQGKYNKDNKNTMLVLFNETCIKEVLLPKYTINIYMHIFRIKKNVLTVILKKINDSSF